MRQPKKEPLYKSFGYAFEGIFAGIRKERNMKIHCVAVIGVTAAGIVFHISALEWCICLVLFGMIMALELVNTAIEAVVDLGTEEETSPCQAGKGHCRRSSSDCGTYGSSSGTYDISSKAFTAFFAVKEPDETVQNMQREEHVTWMDLEIILRNFC